MEQEKKNMIQHKLQSVFSAQHLRKAGIGLLVCVVLAGGGLAYRHQQKQVEHAQVAQARTEMVAAQAKQHNLTILPEDAIRSLTADAIGVDGADITYKTVALIDQASFDKDKKHGDSKKYDESKKHKISKNQDTSQSSSVVNVAAETGASKNAPKRDGNNAATAAAETATAPDGEAGFQPVYAVSCQANNVKYKLLLDAVNGQVLTSKVG